MVKRSGVFAQSIGQVCVIPFRYREGVWEFCLITSLKKRRWIFPKGVVDPGETPAESGLKEAWEEAGLRGAIVGPKVGCYQNEKWGSLLNVDVLLMHVDQVETLWPESAQRQRCWLSGRDAAHRLDLGEMRAALKTARQWILHNGLIQVGVGR